ncbi:Gfo/Idh/MocA family protein [Tsukamurella paurometabola]|uniref:Oxidoreductase domain protein n=1 Tax=Tsukamurella paurometabola (strain ATCC 8368 / DSM 20162 / CCUG 35730 / CIP 100753 / JCM 10117 / KCTC 9821 / NBRC 16120 / NCIMB 702349 / NCTC 13040) TaxID=521096 RepID=D5UX44_TSUPD|nr:Gfo/Idh/MocA family oxidoreductase [Tsukamurella paurometabola]ADG80063.1 oxidoreductase domain protein [Tsukamurella paurometabola DSM 20162]SUP38260.1 1,5-anhydro-D-fructose reductase [Tsukamurella paurometabola]
MTEAPLRIASLGTSSIAARRTIPAISAAPDAVLVAVAGRDRDRVAQYAENVGAEALVGYESVLARDDIDAVYVPLPNALHHHWIEACLESGKHVLAEKPLTTSAGATAALVDLAAARGLVLQENFAFLRHGQHRTVRALVNEGRIGELRHFHSEFCFPPLAADDVRYRADLGGGALLDVGVYTVRAAQYFLGDALTVAGAVLDTDSTTGVDLAGSALLVSDDGVIANLSFGFRHAYGSRYGLWGSGARLTLDRAFTPAPEARPVIRIEEQDHIEETLLAAEHQFANAVAAFVAAVRAAESGNPAPDRPGDAASTVRTAELIEQIAQHARRVRTPVSV